MATFFIFLAGVCCGAAILGGWLLFLLRGDKPITAGEAISQGDFIYLGRDGKWYRSHPPRFGQHELDE